MKRVIIVILLLTLLLVGCGKKIDISIEDIEKEENIPVCNADGTCDEGELCDCADCKDKFECRQEALDPDEYLLKTGMSENIAGKKVTFVELDISGKITIKVDNVERVVEETKERQIINKMEVTVLETEYDNDRAERIVKLYVKELNLGPNEYLFEGEGSEKIIQSVRIKLTKVESSSPTNLVRLDVGNVFNQKFKVGEPKEIEGLNINVMEAHPKGFPKEKYIIVKVEKA